MMVDIAGKRVLVTGGAGFIGSHLCDLLLIRGASKVVVLDNFFLGKNENIKDASADDRFVVYRDDARHFGVVRSVIEREKIEVVFNMATIALNYSFFNPFDAYMVNVEIANVLLELIKSGAYKTLVHVSSSEAYGTAQYSPMDENHPLNPTTPYAAGKAAADLMVQSFYNTENIDCTIIRPFNNYGPRQNAEGSLAAIIPLTAKRIALGEKPVIEGDGEQTRDFIFVNDTVRALLMAYENTASRGKIINLGSGYDISINKLIQEICNYYDYKGEIERRPERKSDVKKLCASSELAKEVLHFTPEYDFVDGLKITLDWYSNSLRSLHV
ncbi:dTDP-glucose 4,6-dehydratase [Paenibacillus sedimenti]|uniref:GDP-mannose 4,6-dehydratase n=1 Tax=Paenibacillus sedimenti TaxID=2770274 RepID=A0A926KWH8_9BACL|nr:GDP-mannose 4,6-dehydratase [Paenibacillus sedimenti]MBD0384171.1 GDP-mannose 4,6-dehydratase [Paenibacillus sedimenti]